MDNPAVPVFLLVAVERNFDRGSWTARVDLRPGVGAHGEGPDRDEAFEDCRVALVRLLESLEPERWLPSRKGFVFVPPSDAPPRRYAFDTDADFDEFLRDYHATRSM
jgi:hypothetical protein